MGERKVLNKYYPPDFDPANLPRNSMPLDRQMKVRMMLPMSIRCKTCGTFMYKGTKFNSRKEDVIGEDYLGIQIYRFYMRCSTCGAEMTMKTDPQNHDYVVEHGASRNYEHWREGEKTAGESKRKREDEEKGNAMKAMENRTLDSKREMDVLSALDELRSLNKRKQELTQEQLLSALKKSMEEEEVEEEPEIEEEDEAAIRALFLSERKKLRSSESRLKDEDSEEEGGGPSVDVNVPSTVGTSGNAGGNGFTTSAGGNGESSRPKETASKLKTTDVGLFKSGPKFMIRKKSQEGGSTRTEKKQQEIIPASGGLPDTGQGQSSDSGGGGGGLAGLANYGSSDASGSD
ncbi:hypothetical protein BSKO_07020 [Bryopsis sp. KO-2023]|nr:hypothetical protein BSKO_07020 [Bryopsis sp. KO-2023]